MTPDEKKRRLQLAEQVAGFSPTLGYWIACEASATRNEAEAALSPICFHLLDRIGYHPPDECICGGDTVTGSPWADGRQAAAER